MGSLIFRRFSALIQGTISVTLQLIIPDSKGLKQKKTPQHLLLFSTLPTIIIMPIPQIFIKLPSQIKT